MMTDRQFFDYYGVPMPKLKEGEIALGCVISMKYIDETGKIVYHEFKSPDIHAIEGIGMLETFRDTLKMHIMQSARRMTD